MPSPLVIVLIGAETVTTITPATLLAFRGHGRLRTSFEEHVDDACATIEALGLTGVSLTEVTDRLLEDASTSSARPSTLC